jgi:hypothetical protein
VRNVADFAFDITEIDGISNSKPEHRYFASVKDFGLDFSTYKKASVDEAGFHSLRGRRVNITRNETIACANQVGYLHRTCGFPHDRPWYTHDDANEVEVS